MSSTSSSKVSDMLSIDFSAEKDAHICEVTHEDQWIIFTCPHCENYRRKMHLETGEMIVEKPGNPLIKHQGLYVNPILEKLAPSLS